MATMTKPEKKPALRTDEVMALLRLRYEMPEYALLENVANGVGNKANGRRRFADALAIEQFGKSGHHLHGFEVKVSRSDWLRELKDESKADSVFRYCDFWWVVVGDPAIVKDGELPAGWGLLYPRGNCLVAKAEPERQRDVVVHDRAFVAAIFRRAREQMIDKKLIARAAEEARQQERAFQLDLSRRSQQRLQEDHDALKRTIEEFEAASGVRITENWRYSGFGAGPGDLGRAVKVILDGERETKHARAQIERLRHQVQFVLEGIDRVLGKDPADAQA